MENEEAPPKKLDTRTIVIVGVVVVLLLGIGILIFIILPSFTQEPADVINPTGNTSNGVEGDNPDTSGEGKTPSDDIFDLGQPQNASEPTPTVTTDSNSSTGKDSTDTFGETGSLDNDTLTRTQETGSPSWFLTKSASLSCAAETSTTATVSYTVTLRNGGGVDGTIKQIVDSPPTFVNGNMVTGISGGGSFNENTNQITWDNSSAGYTLATQESKTFTYTITFDKSLGQFVSVENDVTAEPSDGSLPPTPAQSVVNVGCGIPDTAIGDDESFFAVVVVTFVIILTATILMRYNLIAKILGEDWTDWLYLKLGQEESQEIVERRLVEKKKKLNKISKD